MTQPRPTLTFKGLVDARRIKRMETVDSMPEDWRAVVHDYGLSIVTALRDCGVKEAKRARHIISVVVNETSPFHGGFSSQGRHKAHDEQLVLVSREPSEAMIQASMDTVSNFDVTVTKHEKHRLRLRAAINAAIGAKR